MELGLCLILLALLGSSRSEFLKGVNYGNAFIPEDWMTNDQESIYGERYGSRVSQPSDVARVSLCDVTDDRILRWLEDVVKEEDFVKMQQYGVKLVRVPTGYWNWVDLGDATPNAPDNVAWRFRNLQSVSSGQYSQYLDRIFQWAARYNMKVLLELHGAPGSQNGEIHSGCVTGAENNGKPEHYFDTDWNKEIALNSIEQMAAKCRQFESSCYGIGVLNEPQPSGPSNDNDGLHAFLDTYFDEAIRRARETLSWDTPVVLFSWTYDFWRWPDNRFPYNSYGNTVWDTHIYTGGSDDVNQVLGFYDSDLSKIRDFQNKQSAPVMVGEFALSNLNRGEGETWAWQQYADAIFPRLESSAQAGALLWNMNCQYASWSMKGLAEVMHVQWNL